MFLWLVPWNTRDKPPNGVNDVNRNNDDKPASHFRGSLFSDKAKSGLYLVVFSKPEINDGVGL